MNKLWLVALAALGCSAESAQSVEDVREVETIEQSVLWGSTYSASDQIVGYQAYGDNTTSRFTRALGRFDGTQTSDAVSSGEYSGYGILIRGANSGWPASIDHRHLFFGVVRANNALGMPSDSTPDARLCITYGGSSETTCDDSDFNYETSPLYESGDVVSDGEQVTLTIKKNSSDWELIWYSASEGNNLLGHWDDADLTGGYLNGTATRDIVVQWMAFGYDLQHYIDIGNEDGDYAIRGLRYSLDGGSAAQLGSDDAVQDIPLTETYYTTSELYQGSSTCGATDDRKPCVFVGGDGTD